MSFVDEFHLSIASLKDRNALEHRDGYVHWIGFYFLNYPTNLQVSQLDDEVCCDAAPE